MGRTETARTTINALRNLGRVDAVDTAIVENLCQIAADLDSLTADHPNYPKLLAEYARAEQALHTRLAATDDADRSTLADMLAALGDTQV